MTKQGQSLKTIQSTQQVLTPQQIQEIRMLELPMLELEERIKTELEENPALEEGTEDYTDNEFDTEGESTDITTEDLSLGDYLTEDDIPDYKLEINNKSEKKKEDIPFSANNTFHEFLIEQLGLKELTNSEHKIAEYIIGNIDNNGYLSRTIAAMADDISFVTGEEIALEDIDLALQIIQDFDPPGVGASSLQECLLLQLGRKKGTAIKQLAYEVIEDYFEEFSKKHYEKIQRQLNISESELKAIIEEIKSLNPKPGNNWSDEFEDTLDQIIPDFIIDNFEGELNLSLNNGNIPALKISSTYNDMFQDYQNQKNKQTKEMKSAVLFIKQKLDSARWFIDAIKRRQETLLSTMGAIMKLQEEFFITGDEKYLKPMILKDVATISGYDISTISRVSNSKYVQTNFGVYPLKYLFSESMQNESGDEISNKEIKSYLLECINNENKRKPLSDDKLSELLHEKGYIIARRTVAKYREQLGLPVARLRKEL